MVSPDWTEKYRPRTLEGVVGNPGALGKLREWADGWKPGGKAALLYGPPGVGKTSAAYALAGERGWEVVELNASDARTKERVLRVAGAAASQLSLFGGGGRLVLLEEVDHLHGNADRGGAPAIVEVIRGSLHPVVLTCNDLKGVGKGLRGVCVEVPFRAIGGEMVVRVLGDVARGEGMRVDEATLGAIAEASRGDLRAALRDLQGSGGLPAGGGWPPRRDVREDVYHLLGHVFRGGPEGLVEEAMDVDLEPDEILRWVAHNMPHSLAPGDRAGAYGWLWRADLFLGRARVGQNYGLWRYATYLMTRGVQSARVHPAIGGRYEYPVAPFLFSRVRRFRDSAALKLAQGEGFSRARGRRCLPLLESLAQGEPGLLGALGLEADELAVLQGRRLS